MKVKAKLYSYDVVIKTDEGVKVTEGTIWERPTKGKLKEKHPGYMAHSYKGFVEKTIEVDEANIKVLEDDEQ